MLTANEITLSRSIEFFSDGLSHRAPEKPETVSLSAKLGEYILKLGYTNDHVLAIVLRLMTHGKVQVEFREYRERLELADQKQVMTRVQAIAMFDEFLNQLESGESERAAMTQRIVVQPPRR